MKPVLLKPMSEFDPSEPALLHDALNDRTIPWDPDFKLSYEKQAIRLNTTMVAYDGIFLDGWTAIEGDAHEH
jgi:hypothetical protein